MAVVAVQIDDPDRGWDEDAVREGDSYTAWRHYRVNTRRLLVAMAASGLPLPGSAFDPLFPRCVARTYRRVSKFGSDSMTGEDGTSIIRVDFSDQAGTLRLLTHGTRFTQFEPAVQSQQVAYGWNDGSGAEPIANGEGASKDVGTVSAKVRAYTRDSSGITLPRLIELQNLQAVNQTPVSLPPIYGENVPWTINPGQARYHSFRLETEQGLAVVEHTLLLAVDHKYRWRKEDDKGNAIGPVQEREIYQPMSFAGLW